MSFFARRNCHLLLPATALRLYSALVFLTPVRTNGSKSSLLCSEFLFWVIWSCPQLFRAILLSAAHFVIEHSAWLCLLFQEHWYCFYSAAAWCCPPYNCGHNNFTWCSRIIYFECWGRMTMMSSRLQGAFSMILYISIQLIVYFNTTTWWSTTAHYKTQVLKILKLLHRKSRN